MASAVQHKKARKRKGSLRKTALLGPGKALLENKQKSASGTESDWASQYPKVKTSQPTYNGQQVPPAFTTNHILPEVPSRNNNHLSDPLSFTHIPKSTSNSTTDDDDPPPPDSPLKPPGPINPDSYFPQHPSYRKRLPRTTTKSPLSSLPASFPPPAAHEEWDYSETRLWGCALLALTWIVFVVGIGSCFGVWSWAWDVGETPYAPPELEDDPTLPIVGYYPALIILTGVMAWVWVVVAWVGMKYFRHARISGEEG